MSVDFMCPLIFNNLFQTWGGKERKEKHIEELESTHEEGIGKVYSTNFVDVSTYTHPNPKYWSGPLKKDSLNKTTQCTDVPEWHFVFFSTLAHFSTCN